jgi:hypothetical protein
MSLIRRFWKWLTTPDEEPLLTITVHERVNPWVDPDGKPLETP